MCSYCSDCCVHSIDDGNGSQGGSQQNSGIVYFAVLHMKLSLLSDFLSLTLSLYFIIHSCKMHHTPLTLTVFCHTHVYFGLSSCLSIVLFVVVEESVCEESQFIYRQDIHLLVLGFGVAFLKVTG